MSRSLRAALVVAILAAASCVDATQHQQWCAEGKAESCRILCERGDDAVCLDGGKRLLEAVDRHEGRPEDEVVAVAMFGRACTRGVAKACVAAARASDDGKSLAPLPWLERVCRGGDAASCRDAAATRLGSEDGPAREAIATFCRIRAREPQRNGEAEGSRDEPTCVAAWSARHVAATRASPACDAGDSRACEELGDALSGAMADGEIWRSPCVDVLVAGLSPLGGALACERAGRAYGRACSLRGLGEPPQRMLPTCVSSLARLGRARSEFDRGAAAPKDVALTITPAAGMKEEVAEAVKRLAPELRRCGALVAGKGQPPETHYRIVFILDRTGRAIWIVPQLRAGAPAGGARGCLETVFADANLGIAGDGQTLQEIDLVFFPTKDSPALQ